MYLFTYRGNAQGTKYQKVNWQIIFTAVDPAQYPRQQAQYSVRVFFVTVALFNKTKHQLKPGFYSSLSKIITLILAGSGLNTLIEVLI